MDGTTYCCVPMIITIRMLEYIGMYVHRVGYFPCMFSKPVDWAVREIICMVELEVPREWAGVAGWLKMLCEVHLNVEPLLQACR